MQKVELYIEDKHIDKILKLLKKEGIVNIIVKDNSKAKKQKNAFGILNGKVKNPIEWQENLRRENERDIYSQI